VSSTPKRITNGKPIANGSHIPFTIPAAGIAPATAQPRQEAAQLKSLVLPAKKRFHYNRTKPYYCLYHKS